MLIDFHIHICNQGDFKPWVEDFFKKFEERSGMKEVCDSTGNMIPEALVNLLKKAGVDYAVVLAEVNPKTSGVVSNEFVVEFCYGHSLLIPFANINPYMTNNLRKELKRLVLELGFKGLKLLPSYQMFYPNDSMLYPLYAAAEELQIPVMFHTGSSVFKGTKMKYSDPLHLDEVAADFPDLTIILVHSGRGFWYDRAYFLSKLHPNVFMEIAGLPPRNLLTYFPQLEKNAEKVLYGSDWPGVPGMKENIEAFKSLPISEEAKTLILGRNARKILKL